MTDRLEHPFILWTLQRTGGTNLNNALNRLSDCPRMQDEPFNPDRRYGHLTAAWKADKDEAALLEGIRAMCAQRCNFKHCGELLPWPVSKALATAAVERDYRHVFLYRRDPVQRILSREYARRTDVWGPRQAAGGAGDDAAFEAPLDIDAILRHETVSNRRLNRIWRLLKQFGVHPSAISFEELYAADPDLTRRSLKCLFYDLALLLPHRRFEEVQRAIRATGNQNTRDRYKRFDGIDRLTARIAEIPELVFAPGAGRD